MIHLDEWYVRNILRPQEFGATWSAPLNVVNQLHQDFGVLRSLEEIDRVTVHRSPYQEEVVVAEGLAESREFINRIAQLEAREGSAGA